MTPERWQRVKGILAAALKRDRESQKRFITEACRGDDALRIDVERLLSADERAGSFMKDALLQLNLSRTFFAEDQPTASFGDFRIVRLLGKGGMGYVYEAHEQSMHRSVALKVLNAAIESAGSEYSRFKREAWIAGRLSHPNIVRAYSQGVHSGIHYIVMELVDGSSLMSEISAIKAQEAKSPLASAAYSARIKQMVS